MSTSRAITERNGVWSLKDAIVRVYQNTNFFSMMKHIQGYLSKDEFPFLSEKFSEMAKQKIYIQTALVYQNNGFQSESKATTGYR